MIEHSVWKSKVRDFNVICIELDQYVQNNCQNKLKHKTNTKKTTIKLKLGFKPSAQLQRINHLHKK